MVPTNGFQVFVSEKGTQASQAAPTVHVDFPGASTVPECSDTPKTINPFESVIDSKMLGNIRVFDDFGFLLMSIFIIFVGLILGCFREKVNREHREIHKQES